MIQVFQINKVKVEERYIKLKSLNKSIKDGEKEKS